MKWKSKRAAEASKYKQWELQPCYIESADDEHTALTVFCELSLYRHCKGGMELKFESVSLPVGAQGLNREESVAGMQKVMFNPP